MNRKVLVVDDDPSSCSGLVALLTGTGYDARGTLSFHAARTALRDDPPDVLVVDIRLGPFNGLQLIIDSPNRVPSIVVSGFADPTLRAEAQKLGADFLEKPVAREQLLSAIRRKLATA